MVYQYDPLGRNTAEIWYADATDADADQNRLETILYSYDPAGRMLAAQDDAATYEYVYDSLGRVIEETQTIAALTPQIALSYELSAMGLIEKVSVAIGGTADAVTDYEYDSLGRITRVEQHGVQGGNAVAEKRIDLSYDAASQYAAITRYADLAGTDLVATGTYAFDAAYRLVGLDYDKGVTSLATYDYTYNAAGNMLSMTTIDGTADYTNDDTSQLTGADYVGDWQSDEDYDYDSNGNRTNGGYVTGDNNQLLFDGTYTYEYDEEGNRVLRYIDNGATPGELDLYDTDITAYFWDNRNRLDFIDHFEDGEWYFGYQAPDWSVNYTYDCFNRLIYRSADGESDYYIHEDGQIVLQFHKEQSYGDIVATDLAHRYLWNPQAVDQLFSDEQLSYDLQEEEFITDELLWALTDHLNSIRDLATYDAILDETTIENHRAFNAFGNVTSETNSSVVCVFGYTGRYFDPITVLQNNLNRWYDPIVCSWISEDPIGFRAGDANLYRYVGNKPLIFTDPTGRQQGWGEEEPWDDLDTLPDDTVGSWTPDEFFGTFWSGGSTYQLKPMTAYGCGGLVGLRAGLKSVFNIFSRSDVLCSCSFKIAYDELNTKHGPALLIALQTESVLKACECDRLKLFSPREILVDMNGHSATVSNFASLLGTKDNWYWEWANHGWISNPDTARIRHGHYLPSFESTVYCAVPNTVSATPRAPLVSGPWEK